jgi:uncharacterized DUF497 family protein
MRFAWDAKKDRLNRAKHRVSFAEASRIFEDYTYEHVDDREDYGEERIFAMGLLRDRVIVVIYVERDDERRIISARKAKHHEEEIFWQAKGLKPPR